MLNPNKKHTAHAFNKDIYFLGQDSDGINYWLEEPTWDCEWYWGLGYIESYTNNNNPEKARDITQHTHFDSLFLNGKKCAFDLFIEYFEITPFSNDEIWKILELMKSLYACRKYSDFLNRGGAHYTTNSCSDIIKNDEEYNRINKTVIPAIWEELKQILGGENK